MSTNTVAETTVVEINSCDDLRRYEPAWNELLDETPDATIFQTLDWLAVYWKHFGAGQRLRTLLMFEDSRLVGALPLVEREVRNRLGTVRVLGYPLDNWGTRFSPVGPSPDSVLRAGLSWLRETTPSWDVLELGWTSEALLPHVEEAFREAGLPAHVTTSAPVSEVDLRSGWERYWSSRTSKHRNNVSRAGKKLSKLGRVTCLHHGGDADPRWDLYDLCAGIASQSWQGASTTGNTLSHERVRDFLREVHEIASVRRRVDMHVLLLDGQPAAFAYNYVFNHSVYALRMGYVPQLAPAGPGLHLIREVLREAARLGHTRIDLGEGDARYKHFWRTGEVQTYRICHYRRHNLLAQALRIKRHWFS